MKEFENGLAQEQPKRLNLRYIIQLLRQDHHPMHLMEGYHLVGVALRLHVAQLKKQQLEIYNDELFQYKDKTNSQ